MMVTKRMGCGILRRWECAVTEGVEIDVVLSGEDIFPSDCPESGLSCPV